MRRITFAEEEYYHIYNRGVDKRKIFMNTADYERFIRSLVLLNDTIVKMRSYQLSLKAKPLESRAEKPLVAIGAYCLMPNHFHLYLTPLVDGGVSKFMQRLQTSYTMYFNERYERTGALFQGTFKAQHVDRDSYAKYLFSYIHLNPAKLVDPNWKELSAIELKALRAYVRAYPYSSLSEYLKTRHTVTDPTKFPAYISSLHDIDEHIDFWLSERATFLKV